MSRELLKRALDYMRDGETDSDIYMNLMQDIASCLVQPEPEPVLLSEDEREKLFEEWCVESEPADWLILATEQAVLKANGLMGE